MNYVYHVALLGDWLYAQEQGVYEMSTKNKTLKDTGFIHLCYERQIQYIIDTIYSTDDELVLLKINTDLVHEPIKVESKFPHLYGPLLVEAVEEFTPIISENGEYPYVLNI